MKVQLSWAIDAEYSFVIHTADPDGHNTDTIVIEVAQGLGEGLVGGDYSGRPHRYIYSKKEDKIINFIPGDKKEKSVLNSSGGTKRVPVDNETDIFMRDGTRSKYILALVKQALRIEKAFERPQDIEGALSVSNEEVYITQSRSQVGYERFPTPFEEFCNNHLAWAHEMIEKYNDELDYSFPSDVFLLDMADSITIKVRERKYSVPVTIHLSWFLKLFSSLEENGLKFAGKMLLCGAGIHYEWKEAINLLDADVRIKILSYAAVDYSAMDQTELKIFKKQSDFNVARILDSYSINDLMQLFKDIPPQNTAYLLEELVHYYSIEYTDELKNARQKEKQNNLYAAFNKFYETRGQDYKEIFTHYISGDLALFFNIVRKDLSEPLNKPEHKDLFSFIYYTHPQVIVLSASTLDGCYGLSSYFLQMQLRLRNNPFIFLLIMDIPDEKKEQFLRRNHIKGNIFIRVLKPTDISDTDMLSTINKITDRLIIKPHDIVVISPEDITRKFEKQGMLTIPAQPQKGDPPYIIKQAIQLLTKTREQEEQALSAWLISRGLDGSKRYDEYVYEAEQFLEKYENLEKGNAEPQQWHDTLYKPFKERILPVIIQGKNKHHTAYVIAYIAKKNKTACMRMLYYAGMLIWQDEPQFREDYEAFIRNKGNNFVVSFKTELSLWGNLTQEEKKIYSAEASAAIKKFLEMESLFPRDKIELESLISSMEDFDAFIILMNNIYAFYVIEHNKDDNFTENMAQEAVGKGVVRNYHIFKNPQKLTDLVNGGYSFYPWLVQSIDARGKMIVSQDTVLIKGNKNLMLLVDKPTEQEMRAAARRIKSINGEEIDFDTLTDDDFLSQAVEKGNICLDFMYQPNKQRGENEEIYTYYDFMVRIRGILTEDRSFKEIYDAQDLIEYIWYADRKSKNKPPASILVLLYTFLRLDYPFFRKHILSGVSPRLIAEAVHYASCAEEDEKIKPWLINNMPLTKAILRKIIDSQSAKRQEIIRKHLTEKAQEFLKVKLSAIEVKREKEKQRRRTLLEQAQTSL